MSRLHSLRAVLIALMLAPPACSSVPVTLESGAEGIRAGAQGRPIRGQACGFHLLFVIPIGTHNRAQRAYRRLQVQLRNEAIREVSMTEKWYYGFFGTAFCTELTGFAYEKG